MQRRLLAWCAWGLLALLGGYGIWSRLDRTPPVEPIDLRLGEIRQVGRVVHGNLLGIQPYMLPADYATEARFAAKLDGYLAAAQARGYVKPRTVVVFPEYLGTWLVVKGEKRAIYTAPCLADAMRLAVISDFPAYLPALLRSHERERTKAALFRMKARAMAAAFQQTFAWLAQRYHVTIVAGSILLPSPWVTGGVLQAGDGPLYNTSVVYRPDGNAQSPVTRKAFPTYAELGFTQPGRCEDLPVYATPLGRLGVLICADAWFPATYARLRDEHVALVVAPSFITGDGKLLRPWKGYDGAPPPADVTPGDVRRITLAQAWRRYALAGRLPSAGARAGMLVCLRGRLWDLGSDGQCTALGDGKLAQLPRTDGAGMLSLGL